MGSRPAVLSSGPGHTRFYHRKYSAGRHRGNPGGRYLQPGGYLLVRAEPDRLCVRHQRRAGTSQWMPMGAESSGDKGAGAPGRCCHCGHCPGVRGEAGKGEAEGLPYSDAEEQHPVHSVYRTLYRVLQRYHTGGDALGVCVPGIRPFISGLYVWRTDRGGEAGAVSETALALGSRLCLLCGIHASRGAVLPGGLSQAVSLAQSAAVQFPG